MAASVPKIRGIVFRATLPIPPSVNHCYVRRRVRGRLMNVLSKQASDWIENARASCSESADAIGWTQKNDTKMVVELRVYWPDRRRRDMHNLHKLLADALEGFVGSDDRWFLMRDMDFSVNRDNPRVEVTAYELE